MNTLLKQTHHGVSWVSMLGALTLLLGILLSSVQTQAVSITTIIEADNFTENSTICALGSESGCDGAKIYEQDGLNTFSIKSKVPGSGYSITGNRIFGSEGVDDWSSSEKFIAEFSLGNVSDVWLTVRNTESTSAAGTLEAFDASDNSLGFISSGDLLDGVQSTLHVSSLTQIAYVTLTVTDPWLHLDALTFTRQVPDTVPEPSALLLTGLGLAGAVGLRMRRQK